MEGGGELRTEDRLLPLSRIPLRQFLPLFPSPATRDQAKREAQLEQGEREKVRKKERGRTGRDRRKKRGTKKTEEEGRNKSSSVFHPPTPLSQPSVGGGGMEGLGS